MSRAAPRSLPPAPPRPARPASELSALEARRLAIAAQGLGGPRPAPGRAGASQLRRMMEQVGTIQLDAVSVLARTQLIVPFSRLGAYRQELMGGFSGPGGEWFEYWGHAASLIPVALHPLFRWRMQRWQEDLVGGPVHQERRRAWRLEHADYLAAVLAEVDERGPLTGAQLSDPRRRSGTWWDRRSDGRRALELLFEDGVLAAWRNPSFERVYDLAERVIPRPVLDRPTPSAEEARRQLVLVAARALGVATVGDLADYFWLRPASARQAVGELVEDKRLEQVSIEGWTAPAYVIPGTPLAPLRRREATVLSPFDSLIWTRSRTERLFGVRYRIEIYVPAHLRAYGYYVLPVLLGDRLVARLDLKSDRRASSLAVLGAHAEPGCDVADVAEATAAELHRLRGWLGLSGLSVSAVGNLASLLAVSAG